MAAATAVFSTAELSEMIFLELPMRDLLRMQRVNKFINAVINGSNALQRKLFFESAPGGPMTFRYNHEVPVDYFSGPLWQMCIHDFKKRKYKLPATAEKASRWRWMWHDHARAPGVPVRVESNPAGALIFTTIIEAIKKGSLRWDLIPSSWRDPKASWRRMCLTQPFASSTFYISFKTKRTGGKIVGVPLLADTTLGDIIDTIYSDRYTRVLRNRLDPFFARKTLEEISYGFLHEDGSGYNGGALWDQASWE